MARDPEGDFEQRDGTARADLNRLVVLGGDEISVGLVACGKRKLDHPAKARDLYVGGLFSQAAAYAERAYDFWFILSARHYLVHPTEVLDPYTRTLAQMSAEDRRHWGRIVEGELRIGHGCSTPGRHDPPYAMTTPQVRLGQWIDAHHRAGRKCAVHLWFHAGADYVTPVVVQMRQMRHLPPEWDVHLPMKGLGIGEQRHWYAERLAHPAGSGRTGGWRESPDSGACDG